eukprot:jgi/Mesvir1/24750/Mv22011-RA.3
MTIIHSVSARFVLYTAHPTSCQPGCRSPCLPLLPRIMYCTVLYTLAIFSKIKSLIARRKARREGQPRPGLDRTSLPACVRGATAGLRSSVCSSTLLRAMVGERDDLRVILLRRNFGQTAAMSAGMEAARGEFVVTLDGDLQNDARDIPRVLDVLTCGSCEGYSDSSGVEWANDGVAHGAGAGHSGGGGSSPADASTTDPGLSPSAAPSPSPHSSLNLLPGSATSPSPSFSPPGTPPGLPHRDKNPSQPGHASQPVGSSFHPHPSQLDHSTRSSSETAASVAGTNPRHSAAPAAAAFPSSDVTEGARQGVAEKATLVGATSSSGMTGGGEYLGHGAGLRTGGLNGAAGVAQGAPGTLVEAGGRLVPPDEEACTSASSPPPDLESGILEGTCVASVTGSSRPCEDGGYDMVCGWRQHRKDNALMRNLPSRVANVIIGAVTGVKLRDYGCSLKAYRRGVINNLRMYGELHRFIPALASMDGASIAELPVRHHARSFGTSKYGALSRTPRVVIDLVLVAFLARFRDRPMQAFGPLGMLCLISSVVGLGWGVVELVRSAAYIGAAAAMTLALPALVFAAEMFVAGLQIMFLGLIAEILIRTYFETTKARPQTRIREIIQPPAMAQAAQSHLGHASSPSSQGFLHAANVVSSHGIKGTGSSKFGGSSSSSNPGAHTGYLL